MYFGVTDQLKTSEMVHTATPAETTSIATYTIR